MDPWVLREWADDIARLLSSLKAHSDGRMFLKTGKRQMSYSSSRRARKKIQGTTDWSSVFTSVFGKALEQILLGAISKHMKDMKVMGSNEH